MWQPFDHEDRVDADLARSDAIAELPHAAICPCDECHERNLLRGITPPVETDDHRIGEGTFEEHFHHVERIERAEAS